MSAIFLPSFMTLAVLFVALFFFVRLRQGHAESIKATPCQSKMNEDVFVAIARAQALAAAKANASGARNTDNALAA